MKTAASRTSWLTCTRVSPSAKAPTSAVTSGTPNSRARSSAKAGWALPARSFRGSRGAVAMVSPSSYANLLACGGRGPLPSFAGFSGVHAPEFPDAKVQPAERGADHRYLAPLGHVRRHLLHMSDELLQLPGLKVQHLDQVVYHGGKFFNLHKKPLRAKSFPGPIRTGN